MAKRRARGDIDADARLLLSLADGGYHIGDLIRFLVIMWRMHPKDINCGDCEKFAKSIAAHVRGAKAMWGTDKRVIDFFKKEHYPGSHCFVRYKKRYYDAEEPDGVLDPSYLPFFQRMINDRI